MDKRREAVKGVEREMKEEKVAEAERYVCSFFLKRGEWEEGQGR